MSTEKKFNPAKRKKLNNPARLQWIPPGRIRALLGDLKGGSYLDIGAGTGYMSWEIAALLPGAIVHALDIEPLMVQEMEMNSEKSRVLPQLMERDILSFADTSIDGAWNITLFHELGDPAPLLQELKRVLRPGGRLVIVDWEKKEEACEQGPPLNHRVSAEEVMAELQKAGFADVRTVTGFTHHFAVCGRVVL